MNVYDLEYKKGCLEKRRYELLNWIAEYADQIAKIDQEIAVLKSCQLEEDLSRNHDG